MNPPFSTSQSQQTTRGNSIYNICAPSNYRMAANIPKFADSFYKSFHHSTNNNNNNNIVEQKASSLPNPVNMEHFLMNVLKLNHSKEFNLNYNSMGPMSLASKMATTPPMKIDVKQAGKSFWPQGSSPNIHSLEFTVISSVVSPITNFEFLPGYVLNNQTATNHKETAPKQESKEKSEKAEEEFDIINKESKLENTSPPNQKMNAELKRMKKINKCKNRFNPLKFRSSRSKDPVKNLREKQRHRIELEMLSDCDDADNLNESLEQLLLEKSASQPQLSTSASAAIPICKKMHTIPEDLENNTDISACSPEFINLPPESDDEIEEDFVLLAKRSEKAENESEAQPGPSTSSTPTPTMNINTSPRKTLGLCEKFDRILTPAVKNIPPPVVVPAFSRRERTVSECSEDSASFIIFVNADGSTDYCDMDDFDGEDVDSDSDSSSELDSESEDEESDTDEEEDSSEESEDETEIETDLQFPYNEVHEEVDGSSTSTKKNKLGNCNSKQPDSGFHENGLEKRVRFNTTPKVHVIRAWDFAYRAARKGEWEQFARDNERFKYRILKLQPTIDAVLEQKHRDRIYDQRFKEVLDLQVN